MKELQRNVLARVPAQVERAPALLTVADDGRRRLRAMTRASIACDAAAIVLALTAGYLLRYGWSRPLQPQEALLVIAPSPLLWLGALALFRSLDVHRLTPEEEFRRMASATTVGISLLVMVSFWSKASFSRGWIAITWVAACALEAVLRAAWRRARARATARGEISLRTIIVGTNAEAASLSAAMRQAGFEPVGYVGTAATSASPNGLPVLGTVGDLPTLIAATRAVKLFVASSALDADEVCVVGTHARRCGVDMLVSSRLPELLSTRLEVQRVGDIAAVAIAPPRLERGQRIVKRAFDVVVGSALLVAALPVCAVVAAALALERSGGVLFRQRRVTAGGRTFVMLKFRTMRPGGSDAPHLFAKAPADDPRITPVGRFLRRWSLDELPQLVNVVRGDMSLVGPRPLPEAQVLAQPGLLSARHEVPAGMTGLWQVRGRSDLAAEEALHLDIFYIENWSLAYDASILLRTVAAVLRGSGAR